MYKLICNNDIQYAERVSYVRRQSNNVIVTCGHNDAEGFLDKTHSTIYAFAGSPLDGDYETGEVAELTLEEFVEEKNAPIEDALCELDSEMNGGGAIG